MPSRPGRPRKTPPQRPPAIAADADATQRAAHAFGELVRIMATLRGPDGCPWDHEQTLESLRGYVLEETYEVLDAIDRGDYEDLRGEIGDLIFEGVFLAQIAADEGRFTVADSLRAINEKLVRRHPHIFRPQGDGTKGTPASPLDPSQVVEQWERIKAREQAAAGTRRSLLKGVPAALPSLLRAHEIGTRVAAVGFDWAKTGDVVDKIEEEVRELRDAVDEGRARAEEEMGDLLFSLAQLARRLGIEPESALRKANAKFTARFEAVEASLEEKGRDIHAASLDELEAEWQHVKRTTAASSTKGRTDQGRPERQEDGRSSPRARARRRRRSGSTG